MDSVSSIEFLLLNRILKPGNVSVVLFDELENVLGELVIVRLRLILALGLDESHILDGSLHQKLVEILLLQVEVLDWLLRSLQVSRNLVKSSAHHTADDFLLEAVHGLFLVDALLNKFLRVGSDILEADELGDKHILDAFEVLRDLHIDKL